MGHCLNQCLKSRGKWAWAEPRHQGALGTASICAQAEIALLKSMGNQQRANGVGDEGYVLRAYRCRLEPRPEAARFLFGFSDARRWVFNECVAWMREVNHAAQAAGVRWASSAAFSRTFLCSLLDDWCREQPWLDLVSKQMLQQGVADFIAARELFLLGATEAPPQFLKARKAIPTMRFPQHVKLQKDGVFLPKVGWVRYRNSFCNGIPPGELRSATVKFEHGAWWVSLLMRQARTEPAAIPAAAVAIDCGVTNTLALSSRVNLHAPVATERERRRILHLERQIARRRIGSMRWRIAQARLQKVKLRISRRLHDWRHKTTTDLSKNHGLIAIEDLALRNMTASARGTVDEPGINVRQKAGLNQALLEPGFGIIRSLLEYKQRWRGHAFVAVDPRHTSQTCPECGKVDPGNRKTRDCFVCVGCGHQDEADFVAAKNILARGKQLVRAAGQGRDCAVGDTQPGGHGASHPRTKPTSRAQRDRKGIPGL